MSSLLPGYNPYFKQDGSTDGRYQENGNLKDSVIREYQKKYGKTYSRTSIVDDNGGILGERGTYKPAWYSPSNQTTGGYKTQSAGGLVSSGAGGLISNTPAPAPAPTNNAPPVTAPAPVNYTSGTSNNPDTYINPVAKPTPLLLPEHKAPMLTNSAPANSSISTYESPYGEQRRAAYQTRLNDETRRLEAQARDEIRRNMAERGLIGSGIEQDAYNRLSTQTTSLLAKNYADSLIDMTDKDAQFSLQKSGMVDGYGLSRSGLDLNYGAYNQGAMRQNALLPYEQEAAGFELQRRGALLPFELRGAELANRGENQRQIFNDQNHSFEIEQQPFLRQEWKKNLDTMDAQIKAYNAAKDKGDFQAMAQIGLALSNIFGKMLPQGGSASANFSGGAGKGPFMLNNGPYTMNAQTAGQPTGTGGYSAPQGGAAGYGAVGAEQAHYWEWDGPNVQGALPWVGPFTLANRNGYLAKKK